METVSAPYNLVRHQLINGAFAPGARVRATILCTEFGCSASNMREILFRLAAEGLVEFLEQRGFRMPLASSRLLHELTHLRILVESEGAALSIRNGGIDWESRLSAAHHRLSHIEDRAYNHGAGDEIIGLWSAAEFDFHQTLIDNCGSRILIENHSRIYHQFRQQLILRGGDLLHNPENISQHQNILDAAMARDEATIRIRIYDHLSRNLIKDLPTAAE